MDSSSTNKEHQAAQIDSTKIYYMARGLHNHLFADTINIDSVQWYIDQGTGLDVHIGHDYEYTTGLGRKGGLLHNLTGKTRDIHLEMTALQTVLFEDNINKKEAILLLLKSGANTNPKLITKDDLTPLNLAMKKRSDYWVYDSLIAYGADVTVLDLGITVNEFDRVQYFLSLGANPQTINLNYFIESDGYPFNSNWKNEFEQLMKLDVNPQCVLPSSLVKHLEGLNTYAIDLLVAKGLDFNKAIGDGLDTYWLERSIVFSNNSDLIIYLLEHGATKCSEKFNVYETALEHGFNQEVLDLIEEKIGR